MTASHKIGPLLQRFATRPKQLFLLDGAGALLTSLLLGIVLTRFETTFGMPSKVLIPLSITACVFAVYSFGCALAAGNRWRQLLRIIATANLFYCVVSLGLIVYFYPALTVLGILYFLGELIIIVILAIFELWVSNTNQFPPSYQTR